LAADKEARAKLIEDRKALVEQAGKARGAGRPQSREQLREGKESTPAKPADAKAFAKQITR
jgi:hypothetical protein